MFDWLHEDDHTESRHDRAIEDEIAAAELDPFVDVPFADHTDRRPDPPKINGRVPDAIRVNDLTGEATIVEKETDPGTHHSREQIEDLRDGARRRGLGFDLDIVDDDGFRL
jgi:hypothetical protein